MSPVTMNEEPNGLLRYRVNGLEKRLDDLEHKIDEGFRGLNERQDRLTLWLLGGLLTLCVFLLGIAATLLTAGAH